MVKLFSVVTGILLVGLSVILALSQDSTQAESATITWNPSTISLTLAANALYTTQAEFKSSATLTNVTFWMKLGDGNVGVSIYPSFLAVVPANTPIQVLLYLTMPSKPRVKVSNNELVIQSAQRAYPNTLRLNVFTDLSTPTPSPITPAPKMTSTLIIIQQTVIIIGTPKLLPTPTTTLTRPQTCRDICPTPTRVASPTPYPSPTQRVYP